MTRMKKRMMTRGLNRSSFILPRIVLSSYFFFFSVSFDLCSIPLFCFILCSLLIDLHRICKKFVLARRWFHLTELISFVIR